ncbi:MAG TPA: hypothetical protein VK898_21580 [Chloroflexota bacterium]|nr:hypothetical protein [Chloroflexota bacterium]
MFRSRPAPWAIIWVVYERRQRSWLAALLILGVAALGACTPVAPTASPTAVPTPQNLVASAQTVVSGAQTVVPAAQSTLQASPEYQYINQVLTGILGGGVQLQIDQQPPDVPNTQVTNLRLNATDASGTFARLDRDGRETTAKVVLLAASQFYPQASVDLLIVDGNGQPLLTGTWSPGQAPTVTD